MSALPSQTTMVSAFVAIGSVVMALKLVPPDPFESRISVPSEHEQGLHARFYKPSGRRSPFGLMSDEQVQTSLLNPTRLEYFGRALQKTTCTDASACFKNPDSRSMTGLKDMMHFSALHYLSVRNSLRAVPSRFVLSRPRF